MDILKIIEGLRKDKKRGISALARACGVSRGQMSKYLNGHTKIPYGIVEVIIKEMGCELIVSVGILE